MHRTDTTSALSSKGKGFFIKTLKRQRFFLPLLQLLAVTALLVVLYYQLFENKEFNLMHWAALFVTQFSWSKLPLLILVVALMPVNWLLETQKWVVLLRPLTKVSLGRALRVVLIGLSGSLFTPNRIGEYGGRLLLLPSGQRHRALYATLLGASSQWLVLMGLGTWALVVALWQHWLPTSTALQWGAWGLASLGTLSGLWGYAYSKRVLRALARRPRWQRWTKGVAATPFEAYTPTVLIQALLYALVRSLTYSVQYVGLLYFFGYDLPFLPTLLGVLLVYGLQTGVPLPPSTGLLARGNIALLIFCWLAPNAVPVGILAATFGLWLLNVILPALVGGWFMLQWSAEDQAAQDEASVVATS